MNVTEFGMVEDGQKLPVIDDSNASDFVKVFDDDRNPFRSGFESSEVKTGFGSPFSRSIIPRKEWPDLIRHHEENKSSPDHHRIHAGVPVMNQANWGYCWMYGFGGAMNTAYAQAGIKGLRLNPFMPAWLGKGGRNVGGFGGEAKKYVNKWGMPEESAWPENVKNGSLVENHEVELSAKMHDAIVVEELERNNFDALASCILDPERPCPATMGLAWWGHLVYGVKVVMISPGKFGIKFVNSWTIKYGKEGCGVLAESKATAFEQLAIVSVKPRVAVS
jgi:hypothetical protein